MSDSCKLEAVVIAAFRKHTLVEDHKGQQYKCQQRKAAGHIVCGDMVNISLEDNSTAIIEEVLPRKNVLQRPNKDGKVRVISANINQAFIVTSPRPELNEGLIDRYLVATEISNIPPVIILNKTDLLEPSKREAIDQRLQVYKDIGYDIIHTSAKEQHGLDELHKALYKKTSIFIGQSGVGKSSLVNALISEAGARTAEVSDSTGKGKHTTTTAYFYRLEKDQGNIIDSPGVREFGLLEISAEDILYGFREFRDYTGNCKFRNCSHQAEPGCSLIEAVKEGNVSEKRWQSYQRILESVKQGEF